MGFRMTPSSMTFSDFFKVNWGQRSRKPAIYQKRSKLE